jgi:hypothetical protein
MLDYSSCNFCTSYTQKLWKSSGTVRILLTFLIITGLIASTGCTGWAQKQGKALKTVGIGSEEVKKRIGEPDTVEKTADNSILWVYRPPYKLMPNHEGTVYLQFQEGKVVKAFSLK